MLTHVFSRVFFEVFIMFFSDARVTIIILSCLAGMCFLFQGAINDDKARVELERQEICAREIVCPERY